MILTPVRRQLCVIVKMVRWLFIKLKLKQKYPQHYLGV